MRIIGGGEFAEMVGPKLPNLRKGTPTVDPDICEHPLRNMARRGNGKSKSWTCKLCLTGWKRLPLNRSEHPQPTDIVTFGRHRNRTFEDIAVEFPDYARFVVTTADREPDQSPNFTRLATFLRSKGKGRGETVPPPRGRPTPKQPARTILADASDAWLERRATRSSERVQQRQEEQERTQSRVPMRQALEEMREALASSCLPLEVLGRVNWAANTTAPDTSHMPNLPVDSDEEDASMHEGEYPQDWEETSSTLL